ncbi:MAG: hypothetical protein JEZ08_22305 [Clostridiales bacterium]|nr:hypothetical protein [Clostridiales bacterium]
MNELICNGNVQVNHIDKGTEFMIRRKDVIKGLLRILIACCGLGLVFYFMYNQLFKNAGQKVTTFLAFAVIFYTLTMVVTFLWHAFSNQILTLVANRLTIETHFMMINIKNEYDLEKISHMSVILDETSSRNKSVLDTFKSFLGVMTFEYESKNVRFGLSLTDAEGVELIDFIQSMNDYKISIS